MNHVTEFSGVLRWLAGQSGGAPSDTSAAHLNGSPRLTMHLLRGDLNELWRFVHENPETLSEAK